MTDPIAVDITGPLYQLPETISDAMYQKIPGNSLADFTTGQVSGTGAFDVMMAGLSAQLTEQFQNNRITGAEYTKAYIELASVAMQTALQYALQADNSYWQAQQAQLAAITARIAMETARYEYITAQTAAQVAQFQLNSMLPAQLALTKEQTEVQHAQTSDTRMDGTTVVTGLVGKQKALYAQQIVSYQRDAEVKAAKLFTDAWITQKTMDDGLLAPTGFTNDSVNEVLTVIMANNSFGSPQS